MGYDMTIVALKKDVINKNDGVNKDGANMSNRDLACLYESWLYRWAYPFDYDIPKDEEARWVYTGTFNILGKYWQDSIPGLGDMDVVVIDKGRFEKLNKYLYEVVHKMVLADFADHEFYMAEMGAYVELYNCLRNLKIDFEKELLFFSHGW